MSASGRFILQHFRRSVHVCTALILEIQQHFLKHVVILEMSCLCTLSILIFFRTDVDEMYSEFHANVRIIIFPKVVFALIREKRSLVRNYYFEKEHYVGIIRYFDFDWIPYLQPRGRVR